MNARTQPKKRHPVRRFFKWFFLILLLVAMIGGAGLFFYIRTAIANAPDLDLNLVIPSQAATYIYNQDNKRVQKLTLPESNRDLVSIDRIPDDLQHAFVAIEDSRFYQHRGIDLPGIARAFVVGLTSGSFSEGASTITQQLLKNSIFTNWTQEKSFDDRLQRKIQEQYLAVRLEQILTKEQILEDYLNVINLGSGCYGVQSASYRYFGKDVSELNLSECAVIAAITQNPSRYNPRTRPEENEVRRKYVLNAMLEQGYISQIEYQGALNDNVYDRIQSNEFVEEDYSSIYTYYQDALIDQVLNDLMEEKDYTQKQAYRAVYTGGLQIYSAQDDRIQAICDDVFADDSNFPAGTQVGIDYALSVQHKDGEITHYGNTDLQKYIRETKDASFRLMFDSSEDAKQAAEAFREEKTVEGDTILGERITITPQPQASVVVLDQSTGLVRAILGGRGKKEASLTLNRATYTTRQPGSTFKILTTYAPALDTGGKTLATVYDSEEYTLSDGSVISNWDLEDASGPVSIREAIVRSVNTVAVRCITEITPIVGYTYAQSMGVSTLVDHYSDENGSYSDVVPALALGGITNGVTTLELGGAYASIANGGKYIEPKFYTRVLNPYGEVLLDHTRPKEETVLKPTTAYLLTDAMRGVISDPDGTAYGDIDLGQMDAAGKTGTTSSYRDIWFAGYTPYYTCCIWGGFDNNDVLPDEGIGHTYQKKLWNAIMQQIHKDLEPKTFTAPSDLVTIKVCTQTGEAASSRCPSVEEKFARDNLPARYCSVHSNGRAYASGNAGSAGSAGADGETAGNAEAAGAAGNIEGAGNAGAAGSAAGNAEDTANTGNIANPGNTTGSQSIVDITQENGMASNDGWVTFFDNSVQQNAVPQQQSLPDAPAQQQPQPDNLTDNYNFQEEQSAPNIESSDGITIYSSDETVLLPGQYDQQDFAVG